MLFQRLKAHLLAGAAVVLFLPSAAAAHSLTDALIAAYQNSPLLAVSRAGLRAQDETVPLARAGMRPNVSVNGMGSLSANTGQPGEITDTWQASLDASLVLYDSGQTPAAVESAKANIMAARAGLRAAEQGVLLTAAIAFLDVRRDRQFVELSENNVRVLREQVEAVNDRFAVGEVTRTDVSQAEARLAASRASLSASQGGLAISAQNYLAAIGYAPGDLGSLPPIPGLPATLADAVSIAMGEHPSVVGARFAQDAAAFDLARTKASSGPRVSLGGQAGFQIGDATEHEIVGGVSVSLSGSVPLYQGGTLEALERQASAILDQRKFELQNAARSVQQQVSIAWANLGVARASIVAGQQQIEASTVAFEGVNVEATLGARTTLDVLNAEQELLTARSNLVSAQRDEYVAAFNLLASMGLLTVAHLDLGIPSYDPDVNYDRVQNGPVSGFDGSVLDRIGSRWGN